MRWRVWVSFAIRVMALFASLKAMAFAGDLAMQRVGLGNPSIGKAKSAAERCQECHGEQGNSNDDRIPNHAGQIAGYLDKQLTDFQTGKRNHQTMNMMAEDLDASDKSDIAAYFGSQTVMKGDGAYENALAKNLFLQGDRSRNLPACVSCHGENGKGRVADNIIYPVIAGQNRVYLRSQLLNWQLGERNNSPGQVMNGVAQLLGNDEIELLANYISGL